MAKILLATAHEAVGQHFVGILILDGHTFAMCHFGNDVEMALRTDVPDLIIADVDLPGLDAFGLVETLQDVCAVRPISPLVMRSNPDYGGEHKFVCMGGGEAPEDLRALVRAKLASAETDIDMPRLDGLVLLHRMRAEKDFKGIPVIMMPAHATGGDEAAAGLVLGANDYVRKPFDWRELGARVKAQIRVREVAKLTANSDEGTKAHKSLEQIDYLVHGSRTWSRR
tara:strand:+ start:3739 stop:4416 length:678 start_codon:yes stop_codon:yes gene_type:complete